MRSAEIRANLSRTGVTQAALADAIGLSKDQMSRIMTGNRKVSTEEAARIAGFFQSFAVEPPMLKIPVYGYPAPGGSDRVDMRPGRVFEEIEIPSGLSRGPVIGVRVPGDLMEPRLFSGELVLVGLGVPPTRDRDCFVELQDEIGIVKMYKGQRDGWVFLHEFNPDLEIKLQSAEVKAVHAVISRR